MHYERLERRHDAALAAVIRANLKAHGLDIPGTAYFDAALDRLSAFYGAEPERRAYIVLMDGDELMGGVGLAEFEDLPGCAELQKLYLHDRVKGRGLGYALIEAVEGEARRLGYRQMYLETHTNLQAAIHIYEKSGYRPIPRPESVVHGTMNRFYVKAL